MEVMASQVGIPPVTDLIYNLSRTLRVKIKYSITNRFVMFVTNNGRLS